MEATKVTEAVRQTKNEREELVRKVGQRQRVAEGLIKEENEMAESAL